MRWYHELAIQIVEDRFGPTASLVFHALLLTSSCNELRDVVRFSRNLYERLNQERHIRTHLRIPESSPNGNEIREMLRLLVWQRLVLVRRPMRKDDEGNDILEDDEDTDDDDVAEEKAKSKIVYVASPWHAVLRLRYARYVELVKENFDTLHAQVFFALLEKGFISSKRIHEILIERNYYVARQLEKESKIRIAATAATPATAEAQTVDTEARRSSSLFVKEEAKEEEMEIGNAMEIDEMNKDKEEESPANGHEEEEEQQPRHSAILDFYRNHYISGEIGLADVHNALLTLWNHGILCVRDPGDPHSSLLTQAAAVADEIRREGGRTSANDSDIISAEELEAIEFRKKKAKFAHDDEEDGADEDDEPLTKIRRRAVKNEQAVRLDDSGPSENAQFADKIHPYMLWEPCFVGLNTHLLFSYLYSIVRTKAGENHAKVLDAILRYRFRQFILSTHRTKPFSTLMRYMSPSLPQEKWGFYCPTVCNAAFPATMIRKTLLKMLEAKLGLDSDEIDKALMQLHSQYRFLRLQNQQEEVFCDFDRLCYMVRSNSVSTWIADFYGRTARRIFDMIRDKGAMEQKQLSDYGMIPIKQCNELLYRLYENGFVKLFEAPTTSDFKPGRSYYLWSVSESDCYLTILNMTIHTIFNLKLRRKHEVSLYEQMIENAELAGSPVGENEDQIAGAAALGANGPTPALGANGPTPALGAKDVGATASAAPPLCWHDQVRNQVLRIEALDCAVERQLELVLLFGDGCDGGSECGYGNN